MYLWARVTTALIKMANSHLKTPLSEYGFRLQAVFVWGAVMWLFRHHRQLLQPSLQASMQYLYLDSDHFNSLWTLLIHNK